MWAWLYTDPFQKEYDEIKAIIEKLFAQLDYDFKCLEFDSNIRETRKVYAALWVLSRSPSVKVDEYFYGHELHKMTMWAYAKTSDELELPLHWKFIIKQQLAHNNF